MAYARYILVRSYIRQKKYFQNTSLTFQKVQNQIAVPLGDKKT